MAQFGAAVFMVMPSVVMVCAVMINALPGLVRRASLVTAIKF